jgi:hypothetical protein
MTPIFALLVSTCNSNALMISGPRRLRKSEMKSLVSLKTRSVPALIEGYRDVIERLVAH